MKRRILLSVLFMLAFVMSDLFAQPNNFNTSLHKTRNGKAWWYAAERGGFSTLSGVPFDHPNMKCDKCHGATDADGNAYPATFTPSCVDCHPTNSAFNKDSLKVSQCLSCHGRQNTEINVMALPDVHRTAGFKCWDCHGTQDMHGDGTVYNSQFDPGAIKTDCDNAGCHVTLPSSHAANDPHNGKLHCNSCHASTVITCYNCHFESQVIGYKKRARMQIKDFVLLVNRTKDNKVTTASFQSLSYEGKAFVAMGPYSAHSIVKTGARTCTSCHANFGGQIPAITQYNTNGYIKFVTFNSADSGLIVTKGVVPVPNNYATAFKMDFLTYNGAPTDPVVPSKNWSPIGKDVPDGFQMLYATPLSAEQMTKLGMTPTSVDDNEGLNYSFRLNQNYPNPFNPVTTISYTVPEYTNVTLSIYDMSGKLVETLINKQHAPGVYSINFNAVNLASGVYFYELKSGNFSATKKLMLMK